MLFRLPARRSGRAHPVRSQSGGPARRAVGRLRAATASPLTHRLLGGCETALRANTIPGAGRSRARRLNILAARPYSTNMTHPNDVYRLAFAAIAKPFVVLVEKAAANNGALTGEEQARLIDYLRAMRASVVLKGQQAI